MKIAPQAVTGVIGSPIGNPVMAIAGVDKGLGTTTSMRVLTRAEVGRFSGYGSLATAVSAAGNLSRGADRPAVVVGRRSDGMYEVREAVWQHAAGRNSPPDFRAPFRHFHFEDGSFSQYTARINGRTALIAVGDSLRSVSYTHLTLPTKRIV